MKEIIDGKINDIEYDNASCKILWILKEANISAEDKEKEIDVCEGFRNDWHGGFKYEVQHGLMRRKTPRGVS